ncbi:transcription elongation factor GreA [Arthrobacter tumbae]|uniref:GreA/GreB family elongation factor n=1 Tax=Arthrobacter tumbae TaxID=163874 RepID=UPI00195CA30A|nr:GreA/GreB family elongation factor [Arthrobacter tumbae]MBM7781663.1 transcription elongation factor GreA [Arthrobacter tumbae]
MLHSVAPATWLTQDAYARLKRELDSLLNARVRQEESSQRMATESRIRQLTALLKNVNIHSPADDGIVEPGMLIEACIDGQPEVFLMGSRVIEGTEELNVFSEQSPLGVAIRGLRPGDVTSYTAPNKRQVSISIIAATPYTGPGQAGGQR